MDEIADGVYIETTYPGVTLGLIQQPSGLILIDAPLRLEDARAWRSSHVSLSPTSERLLINLDAHYDRTLGARAMEQTVAAHDKTAHAFRNRPTTFKTQSGGTGAEWEVVGGLGSVRWAPPEISFSDRMVLNWGLTPVILEHRPGPASGAIWVVLPEQKVVFVGDAVVPGQPPFLSQADLPVWIESLQELLGPAFAGYTLVGGRTGLVDAAQARWQIDYLTEIQARLEDLAKNKVTSEETGQLVPGLLTWVEVPPACQEQYTQRLRWGLYHYYARRYYSVAFEEEE